MPPKPPGYPLPCCCLQACSKALGQDFVTTSSTKEAKYACCKVRRPSAECSSQRVKGHQTPSVLQIEWELTYVVTAQEDSSQRNHISVKLWKGVLDM